MVGKCVNGVIDKDFIIVLLCLKFTELYLPLFDKFHVNVHEIEALASQRTLQMLQSVDNSEHKRVRFRRINVVEVLVADY